MLIIGRGFAQVKNESPRRRIIGGSSSLTCQPVIHTTFLRSLPAVGRGACQQRRNRGQSDDDQQDRE